MVTNIMTSLLLSLLPDSIIKLNFHCIELYRSNYITKIYYFYYADNKTKTRVASNI